MLQRIESLEVARRDETGLSMSQRLPMSHCLVGKVLTRSHTIARERGCKRGTTMGPLTEVVEINFASLELEALQTEDSD